MSHSPQDAGTPQAQAPRRFVILTAQQLKDALEFVAPDFDTDPDQRQQEVSIEWCAAGLDQEGDLLHEGYRCWLTEYPEEGCIPLDPPAAQPEATRHA